MLRIDPRSKLFLLLITVAFSILVPTGAWTVIWILAIATVGFVLGQFKRTLRSGIIFFTLWIFAVYFLDTLTGVLHTTLLVWLGLVFKCYPSCMLAGIIISSTKISEFMAAMAKMKVPKEIVIPMAIMFRYFPVVKEDWGHIKDAMALRGISLSPIYFFKNPGVVIDALYVPLLIMASKSSDELSVAAITRGIENPNPRTSRLDISLKAIDYIALGFFTSLLVASIVFKV